MFPFRRAYRAVFRKRKPAKKAAKRRARKQSNVRNSLVTFKKVVIDPRITVIGNGTVFGSDTFELADLVAQLGTFQNLYEEYRIDKIVYSFKSLTNIAAGSPDTVGNAFTSLGMIHTIIDYNDAAVPVSIQTMMQDSTYKGTVSSRNHTRTLRPRWLNNVAGGVSAQNKTGWLDTLAPNVSHYAIKWAFEGGISFPGAPSFVVEPIVTYYVSFRNPK